MLNEKTQARFFEYVLAYSNIIAEYGQELRKISKKKRSGDVTINNKRHIYFGGANGITIMNKKNHLEMKFSFDFEDDFVFFKRGNLYSFIESELNVSGLGRNFVANSIIRESDFDQCLKVLCASGKITEKYNGYLISKDELDF